jgi:hypothetical protein
MEQVFETALMNARAAAWRCVSYGNVGWGVERGLPSWQVV